MYVTAVYSRGHLVSPFRAMYNMFFPFCISSARATSYRPKCILLSFDDRSLLPTNHNTQEEDADHDASTYTVGNALHHRTFSTIAVEEDHHLRNTAVHEHLQTHSRHLQHDNSPSTPFDACHRSPTLIKHNCTTTIPSSPQHVLIEPRLVTLPSVDRDLKL